LCDFCERVTNINTTIGDLFLKLSLDDEYNNILKIIIDHGGMGITRPIKIYYCFYCGKKLD